MGATRTATLEALCVDALFTGLPGAVAGAMPGLAELKPAMGAAGVAETVAGIAGAGLRGTRGAMTAGGVESVASLFELSKNIAPPPATASIPRAPRRGTSGNDFFRLTGTGGVITMGALSNGTVAGIDGARGALMTASGEVALGL